MEMAANQLSELNIKLEQKDDLKKEEKPIHQESEAMVIQKDDLKNEEKSMLKQIEEQLQFSNLKIKENKKKLIQGQSRIKAYAEQSSQLLASDTILRLKLTSNQEKLLQMEKELSRSSGASKALKLDIKKMAKSIKDVRNKNLIIENLINNLDVHGSALVNMENRIKEQLDTTNNQIDTLISSCRALQDERKLKSTGSKV